MTSGPPCLGGPRACTGKSKVSVGEWRERRGWCRVEPGAGLAAPRRRPGTRGGGAGPAPRDPSPPRTFFFLPAAKGILSGARADAAIALPLHQETAEEKKQPAAPPERGRVGEAGPRPRSPVRAAPPDRLVAIPWPRPRNAAASTPHRRAIPRSGDPRPLDPGRAHIAAQEGGPTADIGVARGGVWHHPNP